MFCDMVGSSALSARLDPEEQGDVIAAFHACCANEIKSLGGMVAQYLGDGVLAYFGYPTAHENDAERAILAGLAIIKAVASLKPAAEVVVQTRIAIGSGVVVVGDLVGEFVTQENAAIGETTNLAARLQSLAEPDTLLICPETHHLVGVLFEYRDLGVHALKGFARPVHVRQVTGASKVENRFEMARKAVATFHTVVDEEKLLGNDQFKPLRTKFLIKPPLVVGRGLESGRSIRRIASVIIAAANDRFSHHPETLLLNPR